MKIRKVNSLRDFNQILLWSWVVWNNCVVFIWNLESCSAASLGLGDL